jgi:sensory rhodopsin
MTQSLSLVLGIGTALFGLSSLYFAWVGRKKLFNSAFLVSAITLVSYLVMVSGRYVTFSFGELGGFGDIAEPIFWTRWIAYALSCSVLMYVIASRVKVAPHTRAMIVALNLLVMLSGAFAAVMNGWVFWMMFVVSSFFYVGMIGLLYTHGHRKGLHKVHPYILFGWSVFPVVFVLAPEGLGLICATVASIGYLILDIITKVVFYLDLEHGGKEAEYFEQ